MRITANPPTAGLPMVRGWDTFNGGMYQVAPGIRDQPSRVSLVPRFPLRGLAEALLPDPQRGDYFAHTTLPARSEPVEVQRPALGIVSARPPGRPVQITEHVQ